MSIMNVEVARHNMIEQQVRPWEVFSLPVLDALAEIPREKFVAEKYTGIAFADVNLPLGQGREMLAPKYQGRLLQALALTSTDHALEIGTGTGYLTACMAKLCAHVTTLDTSKSLQASAKSQLQQLGIDNVHFQVADAWHAHGEFDAIAVTGSSPSRQPALEKALKIGGRLFIVVGRSPVMHAKLITRIREDVWEDVDLFETDLAVLPGWEARETFSL